MDLDSLLASLDDPALTPSPLRVHPPQAAQMLLTAQQIRALERAPLAIQQSVRQKQLTTVLHHASQYSPFWQQRLQAAGFNPAQPATEAWRGLPALTRHDLQTNQESLRARWPGLKDEQILFARSSGSTGMPVQVEKHSHTYPVLYSAVSWREGRWHGRDPRKTIAALGFNITASDNTSWGGMYETLGLRGRSVTRPMAAGDMVSHLSWLQSIRPDYLKCSPSVAAELAQLLLERSQTLPLAHIISQWERVTPRQRALCLAAFGAPIIDRYSCEEIGWLALQCPSGQLHVVSATAIVEIVDEAGQPCPPGKVGRVLVTSLHNFVMPLIRYDIGDLAEWGQPCTCGMTTPVIGKLWGRTRHHARLPGGGTIPMAFLGDEIAELKAVREFRILQYRNCELQLQIRPASPLQTQDLATIARIFQQNGLGQLPLHVTQMAQIPWDPTRKREEFMSVDAPFPTTLHSAG